MILDGVEKTNNVGVGWKVLMPRRDWLEPQEQEVPEIKNLILYVQEVVTHIK